MRGRYFISKDGLKSSLLLEADPARFADRSFNLQYQTRSLAASRIFGFATSRENVLGEEIGNLGVLPQGTISRIFTQPRCQGS